MAMKRRDDKVNIAGEMVEFVFGEEGKKVLTTGPCTRELEDIHSSQSSFNKRQWKWSMLGLDISIWMVICSCCSDIDKCLLCYKNSLAFFVSVWY